MRSRTCLKAPGSKVDDGRGGIGGPLVAIDNPALFDTKVKELDEALDLLDRMKSEARRLPIANPSPGHSISSTFGVRKDPLLGTPAMHSGMDFRAPMGSDARVTAAGTVISAGWNGGYGRMVEVRHEGGFTTRYGHLSKISGQGRPETLRRRRRRQGRQQRPFDGTASALRGAPQRRRAQSGPLPEGRQKGQPVSLILR